MDKVLGCVCVWRFVDGSGPAVNAVRDLCLSAGQWRLKAVHVENVFELENWWKLMIDGLHNIVEQCSFGLPGGA